MARKIGFDKPDTEQKKSIADRYLDEFRERAKADKAPAPAPTKTPPKKRRNRVIIIFLSVWLIFWTIGIATVLGIIGTGGGEPFLYIWVTAAIFGWLVAVGILTVQIRGTVATPKDKE